MPPWGWCRLGFRGALPLEELGDDTVGFGDATIVCKSLIRQQLVQIEVSGVGLGHLNRGVIPHDGVADMAILALGQHCIRVVVIVHGRQPVLVSVCP